MGYTHYWYHADKIKSAAKWALVANDCRRILPKLGIPLANWEGTEGTKPVVTQGEIAFNGVRPQSHETFSIGPNVARDFSFCKTAQKPYDLAVTCCLVIAKHHLPELDVHSDGDISEWEPAIQAVKEHLGYTPNFSLGEG